MNDPMYLVGFSAGIEAAAAVLEGRASMARELGLPLRAKALEDARAQIARLTLAPPCEQPVDETA